MKVKIGDKYKEYMVPFPGKFFNCEYEVVGFHSEPYGDFAECERIYSNGNRETVRIAIALLEGQVFYKKVA